jgi:hypothetical protein
MKSERKIYYFNYSDKQVPMIRIVGKYLLNYGLKVGDKVKLELRFGQIIITKI